MDDGGNLPLGELLVRLLSTPENNKINCSRLSIVISYNRDVIVTFAN